jgi:hypothetical protein
MQDPTLTPSCVTKSAFTEMHEELRRGLVNARKESGLPEVDLATRLSRTPIVCV